MKLTAMLLFIGSLTASADGFGQDAKVTLSLKEVKLTKFLKAIEKETNYRFAFSNDIIPSDKLVSINVKEAPLTEILNSVFSDTKLRYRFVDKSGLIVISEKKTDPLSVNETAPLDIITGMVTDDKDEPIAGVTVQVKGNKTATTTIADGSFSINVGQTDKILIFSFVGMNTKEVNINGKITIQVKLHLVNNALGDVVVIGYGTQKKKTVTSAVADISTQRFGDRPTGSPSNLLQGMAAGVLVTTAGSYPAGGSNIKIREGASFTGGTTPVFVVDGFVTDNTTFQSINPNDIATISILKDAASASAYGIQGGNGVVLVTTKQGVANKTSISFNSSYTINTREVTPSRMNAFDNATFTNQIYKQQNLPANNPSYYSPDELEYYKTHSYDALKAIWQTPGNTAHNLSLSGGSKASRYYVSGGYFNQTGATANYYRKYNVLAKLDGQITDRITYSLNFRGEWDIEGHPYWAGDASIGNWNLTNIFQTILTANPTLPQFINGLPVGNINNSNPSIIAAGSGGGFHPTNNLIAPNFQLRYEIPGVKGLFAKGIINYSTNNQFSQTWQTSPNVYYFKTAGANNHIITNQLDSNRVGGYTAIDARQAAGIGAPNKLGEGYAQLFNYQLSFILNYDHSVGKHNISAVGAYEQYGAKGHTSNLSSKNLLNPAYPQLTGASLTPADLALSGGPNQPSGSESFVGRLNYNYSSKYLLGITVRRDASYAFAPNERWGTFPSISVGWNISQEGFFKNYTKYLDYLKIRASYGITGSANAAPWQWRNNYNFNANPGSYLGSSLVPAITLGQATNPYITWDRNQSANIGLDFGTPGDFITGTIDYWQKRTNNITQTLNNSTPNSVGATLPSQNFGSVSAQGLELSLNHQKQVGNFFYRISANCAVSANKYIKVDQPIQVRDYANLLGQPVTGILRGYVAEGIIRTQQDVDNILKANGPNFTIFGAKPQPGMLMYKDLRGPLGTDKADGKIDANDQQIISKNGIPRIPYGVNFTVGWKGINLTGIFTGYARYDVLTNYSNPTTNNANLALWKDGWTPQTAASAPLPSPVFFSNQGISNSEVASTFWLKSGAFFKLKSLIVDYSLPDKMLRKAKIKGLRVYFSGENLLLWTGIKNGDPELNSGNWSTYPILRGFTLGLNGTF